MIFGYRIVAPKWVNDALSGEGARKFGGRWNSPGRPMVYLGGSRALAALEMLVHLPTPLSRAKPYNIIEVTIPQSMVSDYPTDILPDNWRFQPATQNTHEVGDDWLQAGGQLALRVPSVLIPEETNILLNPLHPDFNKISRAEATHFSFDPRL
jgi:RES domain-containing protein